MQDKVKEEIGKFDLHINFALHIGDMDEAFSVIAEFMRNADLTVSPEVLSQIPTGQDVQQAEINSN